MEAFSLYLLTLVLLLCVCFSMGILSRRQHSKTSKLPPGTTGYPVFGETLHFVSSGPEKFIKERMGKYSKEVFTTSLLGENVAVFCGAAGNKFLFYGGSELLLPWAPASLLKPFTWIDSARESIKEEFTKGRALLHEALKLEALRRFIPIMDSMAREHIQTYWLPYEEVLVFPLSKKYALSSACRLVLGLEDPEQVQYISHYLNLAISGMLSVPINLPGTTYNQALKAGQKVKEELLKIIRERKKRVLENKETTTSDILSHMLLDGKEDFKPDSEIGNRVISLLLPSNESIGSAITFVFKYLGELPHIYDAVYNECMDIDKAKGHQEMLNWEDIKKMKYSWNVICEVMRLIPPAFGTFREAKTDINFAGFTIPKGWKMLWSPFTTNKDPAYFPDPKTFDPSRYEGDGQAPCTFVPFGGGPHMCPGKEYAKLLMLVFIYNVVTKFKLQILVQDEKIVYRACPMPANGLPMRLQIHNL